MTSANGLEPVSPRQCALAVGVPLTEREFRADLERGEGKDFAATVRARSGLRPAAAWDVYAPTAALVAWAADDVERRFGVTVCRAATPADLRRLFGEFRVVTLLTHWRCAGVEPDDLLRPDFILACLRAPRPDRAVDGWLGDELRRRGVPWVDPGVPLDAFTPAGADALADGLDAVVADAHAYYQRAADAPAAERFAGWEADNGHHLRALTRAALEQAFDGALRPAPALELSDRLHTADEFIEAVPEGYNGTLDLALCNSALPGQAVLLRRPGCRPVWNRFLANPKFRISRYRMTIYSLSIHPEPYVAALKRVHAALGEGAVP